MVLFHSNLLSDLNIMFMNFEQLAVVMEKLLCGKLGCERGWCPSHSKYGMCLLVLWHFRCKSPHLLYKHYESLTIPYLVVKKHQMCVLFVSCTGFESNGLHDILYIVKGLHCSLSLPLLYLNFKSLIGCNCQRFINVS